MTTFEGTPEKTISSCLKDRERERRERRMQGKTEKMCVRCNDVTDFHGRPERAAPMDVRTGSAKRRKCDENKSAPLGAGKKTQSKVRHISLSRESRPKSSGAAGRVGGFQKLLQINRNIAPERGECLPEIVLGGEATPTN